MFSRVHTKARNRLTYKKLDLIVFLRYNQKLKLRCARRKTEEELSESFNPINLDYIFNNDDPLNLWLSEKEQPVFQGDDLNWLNLDENEVNAAIDIEADDDPQPDATAPFRYSVDQQPQDMQGNDYESEGHLSPSSSHGGSEGGRDGENGCANEMGVAYSSRQSTDYFTDRGHGVPVEDDRRSRRSQDEQPREPTQAYRRIRKGKEPVQPHGYPTDTMYGYADFQVSPSFTGPGLFAHSSGYDTYGDVLNNYGYSSTNTNYPPPPYPSHEPQSVGSDLSRRYRDNPPNINQGTINYGDHHYHQPTFYCGNSTSSEQS